MSASHHPVNLNALVGSFVDADGAVVGDPFRIGDETVVTVPAGAQVAALGLNAEIYAYNCGEFRIVVDTRSPTVTVEP